MTYHIRTALKALFLTLVVAGVGTYIYANAAPFLKGPHITIDHPEHGASVASSTPLVVRGNVESATSIELNDRALLIDERGNFEEKLLVPEGYTIITIEATDRFGRTTTETVEVTAPRS